MEENIRESIMKLGYDQASSIWEHISDWPFPEQCAFLRACARTKEFQSLFRTEGFAEWSKKNIDALIEWVTEEENKANEE